jgi:glycosyltransferase involved in cell wall biosynthesis
VPAALDGAAVDYEIVLADGGSEDDTVAIARSAPKLRIVSRADSGIYDGMNKALAAACGEFVLLLNSDDLLLPGALGRAVVKLASRPDAAFLSAAVLSGLDPGQARVQRHAVALSAEGAMFGIPAINGRLLRTAFVRELAPIATTCGLAADREYLLRISRSGARGVAFDEPVYFYRRHEGSQTLAGGLAGRRRVYQAEARHAAHLLGNVENGSDLVGLARAAYAVASFKLRSSGAGFSIAQEPYTRATAADLARGLRLAWRWRGVLSGA